MQLTIPHLVAATGCSTLRAYTFIEPLISAMRSSGIDTEQRAAHFLAQIAVESASLSRIEENLSYSAERICAVWPSRFKTVADAAPYVRNPEGFANKVYGGRLGNTQPGDGWRYRGRGLKMVTGRANYAALKKSTGVDVVAHPEWLAEPPLACSSAGWFWNANGCNALADAGDVKALTQCTNGGLTGLADRELWTKRALSALAV